MTDTPRYDWFTCPDTGRQTYRRVRTDPPPPRGQFATPMVVHDQCEVKSMVDGQIYTSKAALRQSYREKGYVEVGSEDITKHVKPPQKDRKKLRESIARGLSQAGIPT
jgi:hypothetical protein